MKRFLFVCWLCVFLLLSCGPALAQVDNLTNMSAEWVRMSNRNAATDAADIVVFNPAGLTDLSDGTHINLSNQMLFRRPSHTFDDPLGSGRLSYEQSGNDWLVPNLYASYKKDMWSVFCGVYIPGGGAVADYPDGSITTREIAVGSGYVTQEGPYTGVANEYVKASSLYLATTIGGAYKISQKVSVAAGIRNIAVTNKFEGGLMLTGGVMGPETPDMPLKFDVEQEDNGWGGVFGIQVKPADKLNLAFHCETPVKLDLKTDIRGGDNVSESAGVSDGEKNRRDFPGMIGLGASYQVTPELRCEGNFNYWFQKAADWGKTPENKDISNFAGDCWSIGAATAYKPMPKLEVSGGLLYTKLAFDDIDAYYNANNGAFEVLYSDNLNIGLGIAHEVLPGLKLNIGTSCTLWKDETITTPIGKVDTENQTWIVAFGIDYSI